MMFFWLLLIVPEVINRDHTETDSASQDQEERAA